MRQIIVAGLVAALFAPAAVRSAEAQAPLVRGVSLWPGTELRATFGESAPGERAVRGRLVTLSADTLKLTPRGTGTIAAYRLSDVQRIEVRGRRQRKVGFALGALVGLGLTAAVAGPDWNRGGISRDQFAGLALGNALIGGWVGFAFAPREWMELPLRR